MNLFDQVQQYRFHNLILLYLGQNTGTLWSQSSALTLYFWSYEDAGVSSWYPLWYCSSSPSGKVLLFFFTVEQKLVLLCVKQRVTR
jgi:hypothetical protein